MANFDNSLIQRGIAALNCVLGSDAAAFLKPTSAKPDESVSFTLPLPTDYLGIDRRLRISFPLKFPQEQLRLVVEPSPWLFWPHAMESGLCLHGFKERPITGTPEIIVRDCWARVCRIIALSTHGSDQNERVIEFNREITSYWSRQLSISLQQTILLNRPCSSAKLFAVNDPRHTSHLSSGKTWLASDGKFLAKQYRQVMGRDAVIRAAETPAFYIKLVSYPSIEIPEFENLVSWITPHITKEDIQEFLSWFEQSSLLTSRWIVIELPDNTGLSTYCFNVRFNALKNRKYPKYHLRSSRRCFSTPPVSNKSHSFLASNLDILDRKTIFSRDLNNEKDKIEKSHVVIVGVGSLGGAVALQLARSGIGKMTLIDPDRLVSANLGRHVLGADELGKYKSFELCNKIRTDFPIIEVDAFANHVEFILAEKVEIFEQASLVIITTADWNSEVALWSTKSNGASWSLLQAWSEPYTYVGQVLFAPHGSFDASVFFSDTGEFKNKFTEWPNEGVVPLPACGESFIPGGSLGMTGIASMVSQIAVRALTGKLKETRWVSSINNPKDIKDFGGEYIGPSLQDQVSHVILEREWPTQKGHM